jgi:ATP-binding cassette subfamily B protein
MMRRFPLLRQGNEMDCLPACLRMVAVHHGRDCDIEQIRQYTHVGRAGASLAGAADAAERIGLRSLSVRLSFEALRAQAPLPCIAHWRGRHFIVVYRITRRRVHVADPAYGRISYSFAEFVEGWTGGGSEGVGLFLEPTPDFFEERERSARRPRRGFGTLLSYIKPYPRWIVQLIFGLVIASMLQLALPFLAQALVDTGVATHNLGFVSLVLIAQLTLLISRAAVDFIRSWLLLHIGARINLAIVSDFLLKLMQLPLSFFDSRRLGDLLERISDHERVQTFLTSSSLNALLSGLNLLVFGAVLFAYSGTIFCVFCAGSVALALWIVLFQRRRRELDYKRFDQLSENRTLLIQLVQGMNEIKLNAAERRKRGEWQTSQSQVFRTSMDSLAVTQYQQGGSIFLNELKNIIVSFVAAREVIAGHMTLGMMLAVTYIIGVLNGPLEQLLAVLNSAQDSGLALERINEVHDTPGEDEGRSLFAEPPPLATVRLNRVTFHYEGVKTAAALRDVSFDIPGGAVTAIVGASGSGKTTLLKLLMKIYAPTDGAVQVGGLNLNTLRSSTWRARCGVVMQDGYVFSDTILRNIAMGGNVVDFDRVLEAIRVANLTEVVDALPLGLETRVGPDGHGLSQGQKQRILIARAVYKQPDYLFFDEATSALDSANERTIIENLQDFFAGRTVVVVAHRLSTVRHADQIIVLDRGSVIERGTHAELAAAKQAYYRLVRNQLELGA